MHAADMDESASATEMAEAAGDEVPSFLYAMPPDRHGLAFLQETCLVRRRRRRRRRRLRLREFPIDWLGRC